MCAIESYDPLFDFLVAPLVVDPTVDLSWLYYIRIKQNIAYIGMRHLSSMSTGISEILHAFVPSLGTWKHHCGFIIITYDAVLNPLSMGADLLSKNDFAAFIACTPLPGGICAACILFVRHLRHSLIHD